MRFVRPLRITSLKLKKTNNETISGVLMKTIGKKDQHNITPDQAIDIA